VNRRKFVQSSLAAAVAASLPARGSLAAILSNSLGVDADVEAITGDGAEVTLKKAAVRELGDSLRGNLVLPGHPVYEEARRVLNPTINKHPATRTRLTQTYASTMRSIRLASLESASKHGSTTCFNAARRIDPRTSAVTTP
jgi:hypothetical protein